MFSQLSHFPYGCLQQFPTQPQNTLEAPSGTQALSRGHPSAVIGFQGLLRLPNLLASPLCPPPPGNRCHPRPSACTLTFLTPLPPAPLTILVSPNTLSYILKHPHNQTGAYWSFPLLSAAAAPSQQRSLHLCKQSKFRLTLRSGEWEGPDLGYFPPRTVEHHCSFARFTFVTGRKTQFRLSKQQDLLGFFNSASTSANYCWLWVPWKGFVSRTCTSPEGFSVPAPTPGHPGYPRKYWMASFEPILIPHPAQASL